MEIEQNTISRDWAILHKGVKFFVNFTESDGKTQILCKRSDWEILEETENGMRKVNTGVEQELTHEQYEQAKQDYLLWHKLVRFCIENWNNEFLQRLREQLDDQIASLKY